MLMLLSRVVLCEVNLGLASLLEKCPRLKLPRTYRCTTLLRDVLWLTSVISVFVVCVDVVVVTLVVLLFIMMMLHIRVGLEMLIVVLLEVVVVSSVQFGCECEIT